MRLVRSCKHVCSHVRDCCRFRISVNVHSQLISAPIPPCLGDGWLKAKLDGAAGLFLPWRCGEDHASSFLQTDMLRACTRTRDLYAFNQKLYAYNGNTNNSIVIILHCPF